MTSEPIPKKQAFVNIEFMIWQHIGNITWSNHFSLSGNQIWVKVDRKIKIYLRDKIEDGEL